MSAAAAVDPLDVHGVADALARRADALVAAAERAAAETPAHPVGAFRSAAVVVPDAVHARSLIDALASGAAIPVVTATRSLPTFVGADDVVVVVRSGSWDASGLIGTASARGARVVDVVIEAAATPLLESLPTALAAVAALGRVGAVPDGAGITVRAIEAARAAVAASAERSATLDTLVRRVGRSFPLVLGAGAFGGVAAAHWQAAVNVMAKAPALAGEAPAVFHDQAAGFGQHGDVTRQVITLVVLHHAGATPAEADALDAAAELYDEVVASVHHLVSAAADPVGALVDLAMMGEEFGRLAARSASVDPGVTPITDPLQRFDASTGP